jgi:hypothetical protein
VISTKIPVLKPPWKDYIFVPLQCPGLPIKKEEKDVIIRHKKYYKYIIFPKNKWSGIPPKNRKQPSDPPLTKKKFHHAVGGRGRLEFPREI